MGSRPIGNRNYPLMTAILCWAGMVVMTSLYVTIPLLPMFAELYQKTLTESAATGSVFSLGFAIGCLLYGAISDKYGRKQVIFTGMITLALITLLLGSVEQFSWIIVLRGLQGAAAASFSPVALAYAVEMFPVDKRVTTIGFISTGFLVAGIIGQVFSLWVSQMYSWHHVFYLLAAVYGITALIVFRCLPKGEVQQAHTSILQPLKQISDVIRQKNLLLSYLIALVLLMSFVSMYIVLGSYLSGPDFGMNAQEMIYVRAVGVFGMLISPLAGKLTRQFSVRSLLRFALALAIGGLAAMGLTTSLPLLLVISVLFVVGIALAVPSLVALVGQLGGKSRGIAVSVYTFILFAGTSLGPIISIRFMEMGSYTQTFFLLALILTLGLVAASLIREDAPESKNAAQ
ncbi:MFS transporter [Brevibacillus reuszeri]|uniref:MFS transporter n=1 Tax=Brevibacillus reuszeri TaxID=54915 RepID=UPI003D22FD1A